MTTRPKLKGKKIVQLVLDAASDAALDELGPRGKRSAAARRAILEALERQRAEEASLLVEPVP